MLKTDKDNLKWLVRKHPEYTDEYMARVCDCSIETVKKYRKVAK